MKIRHKLKSQFPFMVLFGVAFSVLGWVLPRIYYHLVPTASLYRIEVPVSVDRPYYKPGDMITLSTQRFSKVNVELNYSMDLILIRADNKHFRRHFTTGTSVAIATPSAVIVSSKFLLPDDLEFGVYFIEGIGRFTIAGETKSYSFFTEQFNVNEAGTAPEAQDSPL